MSKNDDSAEAKAATTAAYETALEEFAKGVESVRQGNYSQAQEFFNTVATLAPLEPELIDRAATYMRICARRSSPRTTEPTESAEMYRRAVFLMNSGAIDEALALLNRALAEDPTSVDVLYVRACAWALKGAAEKAVGDLRQAMAVDPKVRFQAVNDPDFERIREEPAFIDIIEPTAAGA